MPYATHHRTTHACPTPWSRSCARLHCKATQQQQALPRLLTSCTLIPSAHSHVLLSLALRRCAPVAVSGEQRQPHHRAAALILARCSCILRRSHLTHTQGPATLLPCRVQRQPLGLMMSPELSQPPRTVHLRHALGQAALPRRRLSQRRLLSVMAAMVRLACATVEMSPHRRKCLPPAQSASTCSTRRDRERRELTSGRVCCPARTSSAVDAFRGLLTLRTGAYESRACAASLQTLACALNLTHVRPHCVVSA